MGRRREDASNLTRTKNKGRKLAPKTYDSVVVVIGRREGGLIDKRRNRSGTSYDRHDQHVKMVKKLKTGNVDFTVDHSAASLAESWLDTMKLSPDNTVKENSEDLGEIKQPRPARMGLGAKFCPHPKSQSEKAVSESLAKIKKRAPADYIFRSKTRDESDDDERESRTKIIKPKVPSAQPGSSKLSADINAQDVLIVKTAKGKKKRKKKIQAETEETHPTINNGTSDQLANGDIAEGNDTDPAASTSLVNTVGISAIRAEELSRRPPRRRRIKGKKTRSKQKNIRRDKRPDHLKPGFQCPPVL